ncbi:MAG: hypothetical protein Q8Q47_08395 [Ignavibacteriaceae bacterium]|nr:hypothetical protein [Ignavibacteriaceae bacterium]
MKIKLLSALFTLLITSFIYGQGSAGEGAKFEYRNLIDLPTAGILQKGNVSVTSDLMAAGVLISKIEVGTFENISFGISYGGSNLIGTGMPKWNKLPAVNFRFRMFDESISYPTFTLGFDSQGKGEYFDSSSRYDLKSPGFFAAASKNFSFLGYLSLHGVLNYSLEHKDGDNFANLMIGVEKTIGKRVSFLMEYDFAFNDNKSRNFGKGDGYLNVGVRWAMAEGFTLGVDLRDLLSNKKWSPGSADRAFKLEYIQSI